MKPINLSDENKNIIINAFKGVNRVDFSINSIIDSNMCKVFVDNRHSPQAYMIQNGIFRIFSGKPSSSMLKSLAKSLTDFAIILPSEKGWFELIEASKPLTSEVINRFAMKSDNLNINALNNIPVPADIVVRKITNEDAKTISLHQAFSYHFQNFQDYNDFIKRGVGYVALSKEIVVGVASSALVCRKGIEVNIMVLPEYRGKSIALSLGANLVASVIEQNQLANWDAGNLASQKLAQKLGYTLIGSYKALKVSLATSID